MIRTYQSMTQIQKEAVIDLIALIACLSFVLGWAANSVVKHENNYREKANFCADRMKNKEIRDWWKSQYCDKVKIEAIDPITGKPVAGIVEGE